MDSSNNLLWGTYHKTDTVWILSMLHRFCNEAKKNIVTIGIDDPQGASNSVVFSKHARFQGVLTEDPGVVIVRHPKDQIISAARYHLTAKYEPWLYEPRKEYGGRSYQEKISSLNTWEKQLKFEMINASMVHTREMVENHEDRFLRLKYENLINDYPDTTEIDKAIANLK